MLSCGTRRIKNPDRRGEERLLGGRFQGQAIVARRAALEHRSKLTWPVTCGWNEDVKNFTRPPDCNRNAVLKARRFFRVKLVGSFSDAGRMHFVNGSESFRKNFVGKNR
jgi:hypothetical protein